MATDFWIASGAGDWTTTAFWSTHNVPVISDDVVIGSSSSAATVTSTGGITINTLKITPNDELSINGEVNGVFSGSFNLINGMPEGNFGTLDLEDAGFHVFGGTINNSGLILVKANQSYGGSFLFLADDGGGTVTLNGAGMVVLDGNDQTLNAVIQGQEGGRVTSNLINDDNNISGTGTVGADLNIINHGTFETNNFLELGTMQIVGSAGGGSFDNENLLIADAGGYLILGMNGQTSKIINNGLIELKNSVPNTFSTVEIAGTLFLQNHEVLGLGSNIAGNWIVGDLAGPDELILDGGTLDGVGRLGGYNLTVFIEALTYVVCSSGTMTFDPVAATIQPKGVLEAVDGGVIVDFSPSTTNQGTIAALAGGEFEINGNITNSNGGVVNIGANSEVVLDQGYVVSGTIQFTGSNATLISRSPNGISALTTVSGTGTGDSFEFQNLSFFSGEHAIFQQHAGTGALLVVDSNGVTVTSVTLAGQYTSADFIATAASEGDWLLIETNLASPTPPSPTPLTATTDTGGTYLNAGHMVTITLTTSLVETVTGTPTLQLNDGEVAGYTGGSGTNTLTFAYAVQTGAPGDNVADLQVTGLNLPSGSSIVDSNGNSLSAAITQDLGIQVDTTTVPATSVQQEIFGLYAALYNRATDFGGFSYWAGVVGQQSDGSGVTTANAGTTAVTVNDAAVLGQLFVNTQATYFNATYGSLSDSDFITDLYINLAGNAVNIAPAIAYWGGLLQTAEAAGQSVQAARAGLVGQIVHDMIDYNVNIVAPGYTAAQWQGVVQRQETIDNKIVVSEAISNASQQPGGNILVVNTINDAAFQAETAILQGVTYDPATVTAAIVGINNVIAHQDLTLI